VVCIVGDGAMTAGMAFEAMNDAVAHNADLIVVLNDNDMSNNDLGRAVDHIVITTMQGKAGREAWQKLQKQYKQPEQLFSKQYQLEFEQQNGASAEEKPLLSQTADILGKAYVAARKQQLTEKTIQNLKPEHNEFIDYEIFRDVYQQMVTTKK